MAAFYYDVCTLWLQFNEQFTLLKMVFIFLIIIGVVGLNMASTSSKSGHSGQIQGQEQLLDSVYEKRM
jgi:drug/metabolite transporter (DMT)-like permease